MNDFERFYAELSPSGRVAFGYMIGRLRRLRRRRGWLAAALLFVTAAAAVAVMLDQIPPAAVLIIAGFWLIAAAEYAHGRVRGYMTGTIDGATAFWRATNPDLGPDDPRAQAIQAITDRWRAL